MKLSLKERKKEAAKFREESKSKSNDSTPEETKTEDNLSLKSFTNKLENFFSEEHMLEIADDEKKQQEQEKEKEQAVRTARTTIPQAVMTKFGKEFAVPKTNDYTIMKNFLKDEFMKGINDTYPKIDESESNGSFGSFIDKISIKEPDESAEESNISFIENGGPEFNMPDMDPNTTILAIGAVIFILSVIEILIINSGIGIFTLILVLSSTSFTSRVL